jgi:hypothetical protein
MDVIATKFSNKILSSDIIGIDHLKIATAKKAKLKK